MIQKIRMNKARQSGGPTIAFPICHAVHYGRDPADGVKAGMEGGRAITHFIPPNLLKNKKKWLRG